MQNSLFHAQEISNGDAVTDGDALFAKTLKNLPREATNRKVRHHASPRHRFGEDARSSAIILQADLERRGVVLSVENGTIACFGDGVVINRFAHRIVEHKPALLELLAPDVATVEAVAPPADVDVVEYVRRRSAGYWAQQRAHAEIARTWSAADRAQLARLVAQLDAGEEIESL